MPIFRRRTNFSTTLSPEPARKLIKLARDKGMTNTEFIRYIIVQFLNGEEQAEETLLERPFLDALKTATNRICSLLVKIAVDASLIAHYLREIADDGDRKIYDRCYLLAVERVKKRVTPDEGEIISRLVP